MVRIFRAVKGLSILAALFFSSISAAKVTCNADPAGVRPLVNISGVTPVSAGNDLPNGTVLLQGRVSMSVGGSFSCSITSGLEDSEYFTIQIKRRVAGGTLSGEDNYTYKTNVPGVGVRFYIYGDYITSTDAVQGSGSATEWSGSVNAGKTVKPKFSAELRELTFFLVKTGPIKPGIIDASQFPAVEARGYSGGDPIDKLPQRFQITNFTGTVTIRAPTCTTPAAVPVDFGDIKMTDLKNSGGTEWKDASIKLTACQLFSGYSTKSDSKYFGSLVDGVVDVSLTSQAAYQNNMIGITLNGNQGNIDVANGIVATAQGSGQAQGVAVQISSGSTSGYAPVPLMKEYNQSIPTNGTQTINVPLAVRLIPKGGTLTAGNVRSQITYTINYK